MSRALWGFEEFLSDLCWSRQWLRESSILIRPVNWSASVSLDDLRGLLTDAFPALDNRLALPVRSRQ